jgi:proton-dependent oligopeptide transporter, POT family
MKKHPPGLYVLFATEMWERFSFYSMLALFTLYLTDPIAGFGWSEDEAVSLYSTYMMFVYMSPLVGGWLADRRFGYRRSVMAGGVFFVAGHLLLAVPSITAVYAALSCLVIGNGLFKPNVSTMVGNLYPEGSPLKDTAYNIFYMGINIGAFLGPVVMELVKSKYAVETDLGTHWAYHPAFAVAGGGMVVSVVILWIFKRHVERTSTAAAPAAGPVAGGPPSPPASGGLHDVPEWKRIGALIVIFLVVIVFWMVFHQNGSTLTFWAQKNTDWTSFKALTGREFTGTISQAINPFWVVVLTFPLVAFWGFLRRRGLEPSTPAKMAFGMFFTAASFLVLYLAARSGEATVSDGNDEYAYRVSPAWLISSYAVVTLGELMLSPMGLSLVSKVAPYRFRGFLMGGWFVATAIGNKLTAIGVYWNDWKHSTFFAVLGAMAFVMGIVLALLLRPLKRAMPGV